jgi:hypothetical protein
MAFTPALEKTYHFVKKFMGRCLNRNLSAPATLCFFLLGFAFNAPNMASATGEKKFRLAPGNE